MGSLIDICKGNDWLYDYIKEEAEIEKTLKSAGLHQGSKGLQGERRIEKCSRVFDR